LIASFEGHEMTLACDVRDESSAGPGAALRTLGAASRPGTMSQPSSLSPIPCYVGLQIQTMSERRTENRLEVCLDAIWDGALGNRHTRVADLSEGGCYIDSIAEVYVGEFLYLKIQLPNDQWLELTGEVAHRVARLGFGVRFVDLSDEQLQTLRWLITHLTELKQNRYTRRSA